MHDAILSLPDLSTLGVSPQRGVSSQRFLLEGVAGVACPGVMAPGVASHTRVLGVAPGVSLPLARPGVSSQWLLEGVVGAWRGSHDSHMQMK